MLFLVASEIEAKPTPEKIYEEANYVCGIKFTINFEGVDASTKTSNQSQDQFGTCEAIKFDGQKIILTAAHTFNFNIARSLRDINGFRILNGEAQWVKITTYTTSTEIYFKNSPSLKIPATVKEKDGDFDLAIIEPINKNYYKFITPVELGNEKNIKVGLKVMTIGNPDPIDFIFTAGEIGQIINSYPKFILTSPMANPGNSGGPLLNERGKFIGVAKSMHPNRGMSYSIFIHLESVKDFLKKYVKTP